ncbi:methyl-accepting chemotaxis protein [Bacillus sp. Cr_A10]|uniref:methyl-accepting chemotaxis protein n=1 Tax=Bacillus sp. Cr_A10 TaxID=3033993 RepID=UPI0023DAF486|nr:methyl-accepting chemotaxis protein [Bacillus sp. Cr_A10]MDF2067249.1 methyl-accepting chemotaxis protein [Bacillus sp. Cr_A10]
MGILRNLKVTQKLLVLIGIGALASLCIGLTGFNYVKEMAQKSEEVYNQLLKPTQWLGEVRYENARIDSNLLSITLTDDPKDNAQLKASMDKSIENVISQMNKFKEIAQTEREIESINQYDQDVADLTESRDEMINFAMKNENTKAYDIYKREVGEKREAIDQTLMTLQQYNLEYAEEINKQNQDDIKQAIIMLCVILVASIVVSVFVGLIIMKMIVRPTNELKELLSKAEAGDFTVHGSYQSKDELGVLTNSFNQMISGVRGIIQTVAETSQQVAAASEQLTASAEQTSAATHHVANAIEEIATGAEHSTSKLEHNSSELQDVLNGINVIVEGSSKISDLAKDTSKEAEEGNMIVANNLQQMSNIQSSVQKSHEVISSLSHQSNEVGKILDVINDIAAQTNLLALNAAIEAARAGEHGKGFAVVADEVRKLAEQSMSSTKLIAEIITSIQYNSNESVQFMGEVMDNAEEGMQITTETAEKFMQILEKTRNITPQIEEMTSTVQEISRSTQSVSDTAEELAAFAQENASSSEEVAASTEQQLASMEEISSSSKVLAKMAEDLNELVTKFKI